MKINEEKQNDCQHILVVIINKNKYYNLAMVKCTECEKRWGRVPIKIIKKWK